ncbi:MAG: response regulator [Planctomycetaceae bacterium]|jgi:putative two-component system response regulator|nr:response regulator [Planctomycetaceae bacterium]
MQTSKEKVVIVDDSLTNLSAARNALANTYEVFTIPSGEKLFRLLESIIPDVIILDIGMPSMDGYEICARLKAVEKTRDIPVIFLTAYNSDENEARGLTLGAIDYITKPFSPEVFRKRIELHLLLVAQHRQLSLYSDNLQQLVDEKTKTVIELQKTIFDVLAEVVAYRDDSTGQHVHRVKNLMNVFFDALKRSDVYAGEIAQWNGNLLAMSSVLHDVGKVAVRDAVLTSSVQLLDDEFEEMKQHTVIGGKLLEKIEEDTADSEFILHAKRMAETHHERWDGTGYPFGLSQDGIPLEGRLMAIVDVFDALVSQRSYKESYSIEQAVEMIRSGSGTHFDPALVDVFLGVKAELEKAVAAEEELTKNGIKDKI